MDHKSEIVNLIFAYGLVLPFCPWIVISHFNSTAPALASWLGQPEGLGHLVPGWFRHRVNYYYVDTGTCTQSEDHLLYWSFLGLLSILLLSLCIINWWHFWLTTCTIPYFCALQIQPFKLAAKASVLLLDPRLTNSILQCCSSLLQHCSTVTVVH